MDESLDDIFLVRAHDDPTNLRVIRLRPEISWVCWVAPVFEGNEVVFFVAGWIVGMRHAPGGIDLSRVWIDELCPCLMDSIPVFLKLLSLQPVGIIRRGPDQPRAPMAIANVVLDVPLRDLRVSGARSLDGVGVDFRAADAVELGRGHTRREYADSNGKNSE